MICSVLFLMLVASVDPDSLDAPGNEAVWLEYMDSVSGDTLECCVYLLEHIPGLDRLEMTLAVLDDHILNALTFKGEVPDSVFFQCLLWYRTATEPVASFRGYLLQFWKERSITDPSDVISWTEDNLEIYKALYLGGMQSPLEVLETGGGTEAEIRVFQAASLRSLGYPVRTVSGWFSGESGGERSWLEVWSDCGWKPPADDLTGLVLAVDKSTEEFLTDNFSETGMLITVPPDTSQGDFLVSLNLPISGRYLPMDWAMPRADGPDTISLGASELLITLSRRLPSGAVEVWNSLITIIPGDTISWSAPVLFPDVPGVIMPPQGI
jgi:hypothetical protein